MENRRKQSAHFFFFFLEPSILNTRRVKGLDYVMDKKSDVIQNGLYGSIYRLGNDLPGKCIPFVRTGCGFKYTVGQLKSFARDVKMKSRVTVLYAEYVKEPGGALSSFVIYPVSP